MRLPHHRLRAAAAPVRTALVGLAGTALVCASLLAGPAPAAQAGSRNPVTPGAITGYGFDQCLAPTQSTMDRWLETSPFLAAGIYISGDSRGCRSQPNLTPSWIRHQLHRGWRLLPITLGPQASCHPSFPRYSDDHTIDPTAGHGGRYDRARSMGRHEAEKTVGVARDLGLRPGSTLWYDLEGFDSTNTACRESALAFLSGWSYRLHELGWVSGVYSSASSGLKALDDARVSRPDAFTLPDRIWIARWDGVANTSTSYLREDGWRPNSRMKQYQGGHPETWGGTTIQIDSNYLDLGRSRAPHEEHCGGVRVNFATYPGVRPPRGSSTPPAGRVTALKCLLSERGVFDGPIDGVYGDRLADAARAWRSQHGLPASGSFGAHAWTSLLAAGPRPVLKLGSSGGAVRRLQRALSAAMPAQGLRPRGVLNERTDDLLRTYQDRAGQSRTGIATSATWSRLQQGR